MSLDFRVTVGLAAGVAFIGVLAIAFISVCIWAARRRRRVRALKLEAAAGDRRIIDLENGDTSSVPLSKGSSATSTVTAPAPAVIAQVSTQPTTTPSGPSSTLQPASDSVHEMPRPSQNQTGDNR